MTNQTNREIIDAFIQRRDQDSFAFRQKQARLYARYPQLSAIDAEIAAAGARYAKERLNGSDAALAVYTETVDALNARRAAFLADQGLPADALTRVYRCPNCRDSGYLPDGTMCRCLRRELADASFGRYDLKPLAKSENFDTFDLGLFTGSNANKTRGILTLFQGYCADFNAVGDNYLFTGKPGRGKTFLSNCIVNDLIQRDFSVVYLTAAHLVRLIQDAIHREDGDLEALTRTLRDCDLLIIDDLGAEYATAFSASQLFEVINTRILSDRRMIISTNLTSADIITRYDERLASRIRGNFKTIPFDGEDLRLAKNRRTP
jgi:DNA replication protein DnaC